MTNKFLKTQSLRLKSLFPILFFTCAFSIAKHSLHCILTNHNHPHVGLGPPNNGNQIEHGFIFIPIDAIKLVKHAVNIKIQQNGRSGIQQEL